LSLQRPGSVLQERVLERQRRPGSVLQERVLERRRPGSVPQEPRLNLQRHAWVPPVPGFDRPNLERQVVERRSKKRPWVLGL